MSLHIFDDREHDYLNWLSKNKKAFVLSTFRTNPSKFMSLHRASCRTIHTTNKRMGKTPFTGQKYIKVCSSDAGELHDWMSSNGLKQFSTICKICTPTQISLSALDDFFGRLDDEVTRSRQDSEAARKKRLKSAPIKPESVVVTTTMFKRNPDVIAEALEKSGGKCSRCKLPAPFLRASDGSPFLEIHHIVRLADGGDDTVENTEALCPNCHRWRHFGAHDPSH